MKTKKKSPFAAMGIALIGSFLISFSAFALNVGEVIPSFNVKNQEGKQVTEADLKGKPALLFFYPKDETPGCTKQACSLRDEYASFKKIGVQVYGVSRQDEKSHQEFRKKHKLPFDLLVDSDGKFAEKMGVETMPLVGLHKRQSVLITPEGKLYKVYKNVDPDTHTATALKDFEEMLAQNTKK